MADGAIVDVQHAPPGDLGETIFVIAVAVGVVVDESRDGVIGGGDGVEVSGEVEIDLIHRQHLRVATTGGTALNAKDRSEGGLAKSDDRLLADLIHPEGESDGDGSLADTGLGGRDRGDEDQVSGTMLLLLEDIQADLAHIVTIGKEVLLRDIK